MQTKWEYKLMEFSDRFLDADRLTKLGEEGWQLCAVSLDKFMRRYYFKRPAGMWDKGVKDLLREAYACLDLNSGDWVDRDRVGRRLDRAHKILADVLEKINE